jgi:hypothetical protein
MIENKNVFLKDFAEDFTIQSSGLVFKGIFSIDKVLWESGDGASVESYIPAIIVFKDAATETILQSDVIVRQKTGAEYTLPQPVYWASTDQGIIKMEES